MSAPDGISAVVTVISVFLLGVGLGSSAMAMLRLLVRWLQR